MTIKSLRRKLALLISPDLGAELASAKEELSWLQLSNSALHEVHGNMQSALSGAHAVIDSHAVKLAPHLTEKELRDFEREYGRVNVGALPFENGNIPTARPDTQA